MRDWCSPNPSRVGDIDWTQRRQQIRQVRMPGWYGHGHQAVEVIRGGGNHVLDVAHLRWRRGVVGDLGGQRGAVPGEVRRCERRIRHGTSHDAQPGIARGGRAAIRARTWFCAVVKAVASKAFCHTVQRRAMCLPARSAKHLSSSSPRLRNSMTQGVSNSSCGGVDLLPASVAPFAPTIRQCSRARGRHPCSGGSLHRTCGLAARPRSCRAGPQGTARVRHGPPVPDGDRGPG